MNEEDPLAHRSWQRCWRALAGAGEGWELMQALLAAYTEPQRQYHNLQHLQECLVLFECYGPITHAPAEVEIALWFHDAIYDVNARDNELQSARWAETALRAHAVAPARIAIISELIIATRHSVMPIGVDQGVLVDIDLAILGASGPRFAEYEHQIRAEYSWVPEVEFRVKRAQILSDFLARPAIYQTPAISQALETQARANLADSVRRLLAR